MVTDRPRRGLWAQPDFLKLWTGRRPALSPEATADLEEIRQYTAERFGEDQLEIGRIIHAAREQEFQRALELLLSGGRPR